MAWREGGRGPEQQGTGVWGCGQAGRHDMATRGARGPCGLLSALVPQAGGLAQVPASVRTGSRCVRGGPVQGTSSRWRAGSGGPPLGAWAVVHALSQVSEGRASFG